MKHFYTFENLFDKLTRVEDDPIRELKRVLTQNIRALGPTIDNEYIKDDELTIYGGADDTRVNDDNTSTDREFGFSISIKNQYDIEIFANYEFLVYDNDDEVLYEDEKSYGVSFENIDDVINYVEST
ncbi:MAG: hypothetical protein ACC656_14370, partial [Candidatus Heimdallarchaeota archaeon]